MLYFVGSQVNHRQIKAQGRYRLPRSRCLSRSRWAAPAGIQPFPFLCLRFHPDKNGDSREIGCDSSCKSFFVLISRVYFFYSSFRFLEKLSRQYREFLMFPAPPACSGVNISHECGAFVTDDELIVIHHYQLKFIITLELTLSCTGLWVLRNV